MSTTAAVLLQSGIFASPLGQLLLTLIGVGITIVVLRFVLSIAWKLVSIGAVVVGALLVLTTVGFF